MAELPAYVPVDHTPLRKIIRDAKAVLEFVAIYDSNDFQAALRRIRVAMGNSNPWDWSVAWAIRMRDADDAGEDSGLNKDRGVCLLLLYEMCNQVTEKEIVGVFSGHRVVNILQFCLPMDRANALYAMQYVGAGWGMHWVSREQLNDEWKALLEEKDGRPTMNRRILMLMNMEGLGLSNIELFRKWTEPTRCDILS